MAKIEGGYLGFGYIPSLILACIPVTSWFFGIVTAVKKKSIFWAVLRVFFGFNIFWIVDLVDMIVNKKLTWLI